MNPSPNVPKLPTPVVTLLAEYRYGKTDAMTFEAKANRPARTIKRALHTVEIEGRSLELTEQLPETVDLLSWKPPVAKGTQVALGLDLEVAKVLTVVNGRAQESRGLWRVRVLTINPVK
jgi:hypothetical protein